MTSYGQLDQLMYYLVNLTIMVNLPLWCISSGGQLTFDDASIKQLQVSWFHWIPLESTGIQVELMGDMKDLLCKPSPNPAGQQAPIHLSRWGTKKQASYDDILDI